MMQNYSESVQDKYKISNKTLGMVKIIIILGNQCARGLPRLRDNQFSGQLRPQWNGSLT
jgi:hypothetical protein